MFSVEFELCSLSRLKLFHILCSYTFWYSVTWIKYLYVDAVGLLGISLLWDMRVIFVNRIYAILIIHRHIGQLHIHTTTTKNRTVDTQAYRLFNLYVITAWTWTHNLDLLTYTKRNTLFTSIFCNHIFSHEPISHCFTPPILFDCTWHMNWVACDHNDYQLSIGICWNKWHSVGLIGPQCLC